MTCQIKIDTTMCYWHNALKNHPEVEWVIVFKNALEGYKTLEDAVGDYPYQTSIKGSGTIARVSRNIVAVAQAMD